MEIEQLRKTYSENIAKSKKEELERRMQNAHTTHEDMSFLSVELNYYSQLDEYISKILRYIDKYDQANQILNEDDPQLKELAQIELDDAKQNIEQLDLDIKKLQIEREFTDEDDSRNVILEIRAGAGGEEASLFAGNLFDMYKAYSLKNGWDVTIIDSNVSETGGFKEVIAHITGKNVYKKLK